MTKTTQTVHDTGRIYSPVLCTQTNNTQTHASQHSPFLVYNYNVNNRKTISSRAVRKPLQSRNIQKLTRKIPAKITLFSLSLMGQAERTNADILINFRKRSVQVLTNITE